MFNSDWRTGDPSSFFLKETWKLIGIHQLINLNGFVLSGIMMIIQQKGALKVLLLSFFVTAVVVDIFTLIHKWDTPLLTASPMNNDFKICFYNIEVSLKFILENTELCWRPYRLICWHHPVSVTSRKNASFIWFKRHALLLPKIGMILLWIVWVSFQENAEHLLFLVPEAYPAESFF